MGTATVSGAQALLGLLAAFSLLVSAQVVKADTPSETAGGAQSGAGSSGELAEIVVTAQKRQERLMDVGVTVAAVTGQQLQNTGVTEISQLANVVSGFHVSTSFDDLPTFSIRGLGFTSNQIAAAPTVSVYVDEAPLPYLVMTGDTMLDLERVEVLKGPQGTLFGNNSTGGSINFIAAKPTDVLSAGVTSTIDRFGRLFVEGFVSGPVSRTLNARLAISDTQGGNWQQTYTAGPKLVTGAANKGSERLLLDWHPTESLKVSVNQNAYYDDSAPQLVQLAKAAPSGGPGSAYVDPLYGSIETYPLPPHSDRAVDFDAPGSQHNVFYQGIVRVAYTLSEPITLTSLTNYSRLSMAIARPFDGTRINIINGAHDGTVETYGEEFRVTGDFKNIGLHFIAGGNYSYNKVDEYEPYSFVHFSILPSGFFLNPHGVFTEHTGAVFGNVEWEATDKITLLGGARYTVDRQADTDCLPTSSALEAGFFGGLANAFRAIYSGLGPTTAYTVGQCSTIGPPPEYLPFVYNASSTDHNVSWRGGMNFHWTPDLMLYGLISRGYKAGGYPFQTSIVSTELVKVKQEQVNSYEAGVKYAFAKKLNVSFAGFYYDYVNKQVFADQLVQLLGPVSILSNIPKSKAYGLDAEATLAPIPGLTMHVALNYTRTEVIDPGTLKLDGFGNPINYAGHPFPYAPKISGIFDAEYRRPIADDIVGFVGVNGAYQGQQSGDLSTAPTFNIPGYATFDARTGVQTANGVTATLWIRNIANKYYWTDVNFGGDAYFKTAGFPRNVGVTISYRF
jgi:outer membrane receptor protein involved in Fe transport